MHYLKIINSFWEGMSDVLLLNKKSGNLFLQYCRSQPTSNAEAANNQVFTVCILEKMPVATYACRACRIKAKVQWGGAPATGLKPVLGC